MSNQNDTPLTETPEEGDVPIDSTATSEEDVVSTNAFARFWASVQELGITETVTRVGSSVLTVLLVIVAVYALGRFYINSTASPDAADPAQPVATKDLASGDSTDITEIIMPEFSQPPADEPA